jgi:hypothetical protein
MTTFQNIKTPYLTIEEGSAPDTPDAGHQRLFIDEADGALKKINDADVVEAVGGIANHDYYTYLAALLEPDAIEAIQKDSFSYAVSGSVTKLLRASWYTRLGSAGRMEVRDPRSFVTLRGVTLAGLGSGACAMIIDPALPTYTNAHQTYLDRMLTLMESTPQYLGIAASTTVPLLTGAYGAIVLHSTNYNSAWNSIRTEGDTYGWNLDNEINDSSAFRTSADYRQFGFPIDKKVASEFRNEGGADTGQTRGSGLLYYLCPSTWSAIVDATTYLFRDDFMASSLDTSVKWASPSQSTGGNVAINTFYQWLKLIGTSTWGQNGVHSQYNVARASGKKLIMDVYTAVKTGSHLNNSVIVGWHDGAGDSYTDFSHGILFTSSGAAPILKVYENGNDRGTVGSGYTLGTIYRVRITLDSAGANSAKYEIQGGAYGALGSASWTDITPGTTSSSTTPVYVGVASGQTNTFYISDVKVTN